MTKDNRTIKTTNPYSGQSTMLNKEEYALYHIIKGAEIVGNYNVVRKGLDKFSRMNAEAYMVLLDYLSVNSGPGPEGSRSILTIEKTITPPPPFL